MPRVYKSKPKPGTKRFQVQQLHQNTDPKFAVFQRSQSGASAKFQYLHDSIESAVECARKFAASTASHGHVDFTYYVVEVKHRVGIEHGKLVDESME